MTKIMLVEDDKSLREIYGVRLLAEGYDIVSAGDGEEALALAIKERPALIISDVMMPKISGFDFLDILRSTTETKNIRIIMMTALSSEDQRMRGEQLGADRYLVKSQVGIEDVVHVVHEVLGDKTEQAQVAGSTPGTATTPHPQQQPVQPPVASTAPTNQPQPIPMPTPAPIPDQPQPSGPVDPNANTPKPAQSRGKILQPLNDLSEPSINMKELLDKELAKEAGLDPDSRPEITTTNAVKADDASQLQAFTPPADSDVAMPAAPAPQSDIPMFVPSSDPNPPAPVQSNPTSIPVTDEPALKSIDVSPTESAPVTTPETNANSPTTPAPVTQPIQPVEPTQVTQETPSVMPKPSDFSKLQ